MNRALQIGAFEQGTAVHDFSGWRSMDAAPRDGTWVELKCTYGVAPWYCIARWTDEYVCQGRNGERYTGKSDKPSWQKPEGGGPFSEGSLHWRPYSGEVSAYADPTGGMQNDPAYWRGAVANKYGLPLDHFEKMAAKNRTKNERSTLPWWKHMFT